MYQAVKKTLDDDLVQSGVLQLLGDLDEFRIAKNGHVLIVDDSRYTCPEDFTISVDGSGDVTLTWLNATTIPENKTIRVGIAYVDSIVSMAQSVGLGGGDATAAHQATANTLLTALTGYMDGVEAKLDTVNTKLQSLLDDASVAAVYSPVTITSLTPSIVSGAGLASGDVIADTEILAAAVRADDAKGILQSVIVVDESDTGAAFDIYILSDNVAMGTEDGGATISDANSAKILGWVSVATTDYKDVGGAKVAMIKNIGLPVMPKAGTDDLYVAIVNGTGTPNFGSATALKLLFSILS